MRALPRGHLLLLAYCCSNPQIPILWQWDAFLTVPVAVAADAGADAVAAGVVAAAHTAATTRYAASQLGIFAFFGVAQ